MRPLAERFFAVFTLLAFLTASVCPALPAAAQEEGGSRYNEVLQRALEEFNLGNWQEARALFRKAHQMNPNARTLRGMGMAAFEMRSYLAALQDLEASLRDQRKPLTSEQREHVVKLIERTRAFLGRYHVEVEPPNATLQVDGSAAEIGEEGVLVLELGNHEIVAMASGYQEQKRSILSCSSYRSSVTLRENNRLPVSQEHFQRSLPAVYQLLMHSRLLHAVQEIGSSRMPS